MTSNGKSEDKANKSLISVNWAVRKKTRAYSANTQVLKEAPRNWFMTTFIVQNSVSCCIIASKLLKFIKIHIENIYFGQSKVVINGWFDCVMQFIYCELNAFIFLKSLQLFLSELSFNHFQITKYQLCSNLFLYFRKQTRLLLRDWLYHLLPKQCHMSRKSPQKNLSKWKEKFYAT